MKIHFVGLLLLLSACVPANQKAIDPPVDFPLKAGSHWEISYTIVDVRVPKRLTVVDYVRLQDNRLVVSLSAQNANVLDIPIKSGQANYLPNPQKFGDFSFTLTVELELETHQ